MEMLSITASPKLRGVPTNALKGVKLASKTLFYGVNGSGKTTICEILAAPEKVTFEPGPGPKYVYAFTGDWMRDTVGEFVQGGSAPAVTTVAFGEGVAGVEREIEEAARKVELQQNNLTDQSENVRQLEQKERQALDKIFNGVRKTLEDHCESLGPRRFNRSRIKEVLNEGVDETLSTSEVDKFLEIANAATQPQIDIPSFGSIWHPTEELKKLIETPVSARGSIVLNSWIKEGFGQHSAGDECKFCGNTVTKDRLELLENAIVAAENSLNDKVLTAIDSAGESLRRLKEWIDYVRRLQVDAGDEVDSFDISKTNVLRTAAGYINNLEEFRNCALKRRDNPNDKVVCPNIISESFEQSSDYLNFVESIATVNRNRLNLEERKAQSVEKLKVHCCSKDGAGWSELKAEQEVADCAVEQAQRDLNDAKAELRKSQSKLSTTAWVAEFIEEGLELVLGEGNLSVEQSEDESHYELKRLGKKATFLSEGEKKLVALLYFCSTLYEPHRKETISESVLIFDDLASELDQTRQANISRLIDSKIDDLKVKPLSVCFFTHSSEFLRQKLPQFRNKIYRSERAGKVPNVAVYEVYKSPSADDGTYSTVVTSWSKEALKLDTEYELSLYKVCSAAIAIQGGTESESIDLLVGNYCRKVLEVFSEFKRPGHDKFGHRVDEMLKRNTSQKKLPANLARNINELCHSYLNKDNPLWTRHSSITAIFTTLKFVYLFDPVHLELMVQRLLGKDEWEQLKSLVEDYRL